MNERYPSLDSNNKLIWNFRDIGHTMRQISEGRGSQKRILMILQESGGMTQRALTERLVIQPGSASEIIGKLEAAGYLVRIPSDTDRRTFDLSLTEAGQTAAAEAWTARNTRHQIMFSCLTETEKQTLLQLLEKINAFWDQEYRCSDMPEHSHGSRKGHGGAVHDTGK